MDEKRVKVNDFALQITRTENEEGDIRRYNGHVMCGFIFKATSKVAQNGISPPNSGGGTGGWEVSPCADLFMS